MQAVSLADGAGETWGIVNQPRFAHNLPGAACGEFYVRCSLAFDDGHQATANNVLESSVSPSR